MKPKYHPVFYFLPVLIVGAFIHTCFTPGWPATLEFLSVVAGSAFIVWLNPAHTTEVKSEQFDELKEKVLLLQEQLRNMRIKIGFERATG